MMKQNTGAVRRLFFLSLIALPIIFAGCDPKPEGPKHADHAAAHARRYHPDIDQHRIDSPQPEASPSTQPTENFSFSNGPAGSPVMFVNGEPLTVMEVLEPIIDDLARQSKALTENDYRDSVMRLVRDRMDYLISTLVVYQDAKKTFGGEKIQEAFDKRADELVKDTINSRYGGVYARYEAHLKALEITPAEMKARVKREAMVKEFLRERFKPMLKEPPRRDLLKYYEAHIKEYQSPERAELFLIEIPIEAELDKRPDQATAEDKQAARERAIVKLKRAREEIDSGIDFTTVARAYSKGAMAQQGGAYGEISPGALANRWAKAETVLFTLQANQVSDIVDTDEALFIVKCGSKTPSQQLSFEEAQRKIMDEVVEEQFAKLRNNYIRELMSKATVRQRAEFLQAVLAAVPRPPAYEPAARSNTTLGK
jgi:parvulin-like peptidyl-prolyl isomerase